MAQISVQYIIEHEIDSHDMSLIKKELDKFHGVHSVSVNQETALICIDFDMDKVKEGDLINKLQSLGYRMEFVDRIIF